MLSWYPCFGHESHAGRESMSCSQEGHMQFEAPPSIQVLTPGILFSKEVL